LQTQGPPIVLALLVIALVGGCGSSTSSDAPEVMGTGSGEIAYTVNREGWNEIWVMDASGENRRRLTDPQPSGSDAAGSMSPAWSPQGDRIAFVSSGDARAEDQDAYELYVMDAASGKVRQLTKNDKLDADPSWSPDGKRILFVQAEGWGTKQVRMSLSVIGADGSDERVLREEANEDGPVFLNSPAWSPDGARIAFTRSGVGAAELEPEVYVVGSNASGGLQWTIEDAAEPAWSPNGKRLAFTGIGDDHGQTCFHECTPSGEIYVADVYGDDVIRLTRSEADDTSPAWSPDGTEIVFSSDRSNRQDHELELYVLPVTGGEPRRLTRNKVWDLDPNWRQTSVAYGWSEKKEPPDRADFEAWRGFRTRSGGINCFMTGKAGWNGFVCFRASDGFFTRMAGRDLSTDDPVRVVTGTDPGFLGYENADVTEVEPGDDWYSSDAQMVGCSVRLAAVLCRHASGHGFSLDLAGHKTF
jgi:Tol biopolymer transport system component